MDDEDAFFPESNKNKKGVNKLICTCSKPNTQSHSQIPHPHSPPPSQTHTNTDLTQILTHTYKQTNTDII